MTFDDFTEQCLPIHTARFPCVATWIKKAGDLGHICIESFHRAVRGHSVEVFLEASKRLMAKAPRFGEDHPAAMADKCRGVRVAKPGAEQGSDNAAMRLRFPVGKEVAIDGRGETPALAGVIERHTDVGAYIKLDEPYQFGNREPVKVFGRTWAEIHEVEEE